MKKLWNAVVRWWTWEPDTLSNLTINAYKQWLQDNKK